MEETAGIRSVRRAMALLNHFTAQRPCWSITELSQVTGLHKSVVYRLLASMELDGFVSQDPRSKKYRIGPQAFAVGSTFRPFLFLEQLAYPVIETLVEQTGHSSSLGVTAGLRFIIVLSIQSNRAIRVAFDVGERPYYHSAAIGKLLLAYMSDDEVAEIVGTEPFPVVTPHTIASAKALQADLMATRQRGYSVSWEESIVGVGGVAAAVTNSARECIASLGMAFPVHLVSNDGLCDLGRQTAEAAATLSRSVKTLSLDDYRVGR